MGDLKSYKSYESYKTYSFRALEKYFFLMKTVKGLTTLKAESLLTQYGQNVIKDREKSSIFQKFIEQTKSFLMILLIAAALVSFFIGEVVDGSLIITIIFLNAVFGVYQEYKAEEAVAALKKMTISTIRVLRDGKEREIDSRYLVPGDIIYVEEGVKLPADAQILDTVSLEVNEAALTGESIPVIKAAGDPFYMGTIVSKGRAEARVTHTAMQTKFGQIAAKLSSVEDAPTPLQIKLGNLTQLIGIMGMLLSFAVFGLSAFQGHGYFPSFLLAVSLAVAVVPESLPAVMTVILSVGVKHMAAKKAIVRKLASIEGIGNITLIATDKTGTLTSNNMEVKQVWYDEKTQEVAERPHLSHALELLIIDGVVCSTATLVSKYEGRERGQADLFKPDYEVLGDPTEGALLLFAKKLNLDHEVIRKEWQVVDEVPFDSITKRMTVVVKRDHLVAFSKGAPESILSISSKIMIDGKTISLTDEKRKEIEKSMKEWAEKGLRILAFSYRPCDRLKCAYQEDNIFLGMVALHDPPRPEAAESIKRAKEAGINVVMITGDNERTAEAIGWSIGLLEKGDDIVKGEQIDKYSDQELLEILPHTKVFARTTPFHKQRIVALYQKLGEVVAVTGDGVNDAIALKQADVGIAMGKVGTDVARETADLVITDDNFETIVNAVEEGRNIVKRLKNAIKYLLTGNLSEGLTLLVGLMLGLPPILVPIQILYINLISDGVPALALAFSPRDEHVMKGPFNHQKHILLGKDIQYIVGVGAIAMLIVMAVFIFLSGKVEMVQRTAAFSVLAMIQTFIFVDMWLSHRSIFHHVRALFSKFFMFTLALPIVLQFAIVSIPQLAHAFESTTLPLVQFIFYVCVSMLILIGIRVVKMLVRI